MTYHRRPTTLIARAGYGQVGDDLYVGPHGKLYEPTAGILDFLKGAGKGVVDFYNQAQQNKGAAAALTTQTSTSSGLPSWVLPAAVVGGGVVLALMLTKKRKNPGRRARRNASYADTYSPARRRAQSRGWKDSPYATRQGVRDLNDQTREQRYDRYTGEPLKRRKRR